MTTAEVDTVGRQLDAHHAPETNGRMAVCRRCGSRTDSPEGGHHMPPERQLIRSSEWLVAQSRLVDIARAKAMRAP
jgi:hypothetical protein